MVNDNLYIEIEKAIKKGSKLKKKDILAVPSLSSNPITKILLKIYEKNNTINFRDLVNDLRMFVSENPLDDKLKFLFKLYDSDGDGVISDNELFAILELLCEGNLESDKIQNIVDHTFRECDAEIIDFERFKMLIKKRTKNINTYFFARK